METVILGCGYIGTALLKFWQGKKSKLVATTTHSQKCPQLAPFADKVYVVKGQDRQSLPRILATADQLVISVAPGMSGDFRECYLETAYAVCETLPHTNVQQVLYTSSTSVYGECQGAWVTEETELYPTNANEEILCQVESVYLTHLPKNIQTSVLRLGGIFGPERELEKRAKKLAGKECAGCGDSFCNFIHRDDVVGCIDWIFDHHLSGLYNLCHDEHPTRDAFYEQILAKYNLPPINWNPHLPGLHIGNKRVATDKIKATGFKLMHCLQASCTC